MDNLLNTVFRYSGLSSPDLGNTAIIDETDPFPGVAGNINENPLKPVDPDIPALPRIPDDVVKLLTQIRDALHRANPVHVNEHWDLQTYFLPAGTTGEIKIFRSHEPFRFVTILNSPKAANVYLGAGIGMRLKSLAAGESMQAEFPTPIDAVTYQHTAAAVAGDYVTVILSARAIKISSWT